MTRDTADQIGNELQDTGFDYARYVTGDQHRIELLQQRFEGKELLMLMGILVPGGKPLAVAVSFEYSRGVVIV